MVLSESYFFFLKFVMHQVQKIWGIDIFRGLAALLVFCFHYWTFFPDAPFFTNSFLFSVFSAGHLGVDIFFVLSGFLVTLSLFSTDNISLYLQKRIRRIVPLAWLVLAGVVMLKTMMLGGEYLLENGLDIVVHFLFVQAFFFDFYHGINPVMWTLSVELLFYFVLPLLWVYIAKKNISKFLIVGMFLVFLSFVWRSALFFFCSECSVQEYIFLSEQLWGRFDQFFLGILLAIFIFYSDRVSFSPLVYLRHHSFFRRVLLLLGIILSGYVTWKFSVVGSGFRDFFVGQVFFHSVMGLGVFFILLWFLSISSNLSSRFRSVMKPLEWCGKISYGIYLFHFPVIALFAQKKDVLIFLNADMFLFVVLFFFSLLITLLMSWVSYEWFEKKFLLQNRK